MQTLLNNKKFHYIFLVYFGLLTFLGRVAWSGLRPDADAWYAQKAKELIASGNFFVINFHGVPTFEHTPFFIWMQVVSFKLFGISTYSAVLPSALFATGTVVLTYKIAHRMFDDRWIAFVAGIILMFPGYYLETARRGQVAIAHRRTGIGSSAPSRVGSRCVSDSRARVAPASSRAWSR